MLIVTDKIGSAIWRLAKGNQKESTHLNIKVIAVHPKRPSPEQLQEYNEGVKWADVVDYAYWKTALMLLDNFANDKPKILTHYNPYSIYESAWKQFNKVVACNHSIYNDLKKSGAIQIGLSIDLDFFKFNREYDEKSKTVIMVAARIEGKKGILEVAEACRELGYKFLLVGSVSDRDYFQRVIDVGGVDFRENISDEDLLKCYHDSAVHVCNSVDQFESGTLPILEAMATGVPVLTRNVGHVPDLFDGSNMVVRKGKTEDMEDLKNELLDLMGNLEKRKDIRESAWKTVKARGFKRRAREYEKLYWQIFKPFNELVSVVIPTFNRKEILAKVLEGIMLQSWEAKEIIVANDGSTDGTREFIMSLREKCPIPIKYVNTGMADRYGLAIARNLGVIEALGEIIVFIDDRYYAEPQMVEQLLKELREKTWIFGNKGKKKDFVENVSCVNRQEFIDAGMFNGSVPLYGFLTQEIRNRFGKQGFKFKFAPKARVHTLLETKNRYRKKEEIRAAKDLLWQMNL